MTELLGNITLNISLAIYLVWFVPQLLLNFKRKNTAGLSLWMHGILCIGYLSDLLYGFGRGMEWQYRLVTIIGLAGLIIQHYQFFRYGTQQRSQKISYLVLNMMYLALLGYAVATLIFQQYSAQFYIFAGLLANGCWLVYMAPQIVKNYINQSTAGLSTTFVLLATFLNLCDLNSAWGLGWDYPSKIGPMVALLGNSILLLQIRHYGQRQLTVSA
jgi:uncharacterized protein with PQ loop repeat